MARILVADDEAPMRTSIRHALENQGHTVVTVSDGAEALGAMKRSAFELLISDIAMPVMDGIALALAVGKDKPKLPIILMTGFSDQRQRAYNLEALVHLVIEKPFTLDQICGAVDSVLAPQAAKRTS